MTHVLEVLEVLCQRSVASRSLLAEMTGLSPATISRTIALLRKDGLVIEREVVGQGVGRPARVVHLRAQAAHVLGIDAGGSRVRVLLSDLEGKVHRRVTRSVRAARRPEDVVDAIVELAGEVRDQAGGRVIAAAAGVSGIVDAPKGTVLLSPDLPTLSGTPTEHMLEQALGVPTVIDNDDLLAAMGEVAFGAAQGCTDVAFISMGHGLGAGLIVGGQPVRGARSSAGAIAYLAPGRLEDRASGRAIPRRYLQRRSIRTSSGRQPQMSAERVFALAKDGDAIARDVVEEAITAWGDLVVDVAALLDPQIIVVGGGLARSQSDVLDRLDVRLNDALPFPPRLVASDLGEDAVARGAVSLALTLARRRLAGQPSGLGLDRNTGGLVTRGPMVRDAIARSDLSVRR